ncbi:MAG: ABC transporter substrate-binding protein [Acidimicrobiia bacterium]
MGRRARLLVALVGSYLLLTACGAGSEDDAADEPAGGEEVEATCEKLPGEPVLIGIGVAQTSPVALLGQEEVIGAKIAENFFNCKEGVNGRPIQLIFEDTGGDENGAINAFNALIGKGVVGIVGPTLSQQANAADPEAERAGVPVLAPSNTAKGIPQLGDYIARVSAPVAVVAPLAVEQALSMNPDIKTVAVAYAQNDAFSASETGTFQETVKAKGLNLATVQTFQTSDTDFTAQANAMLGRKPELIIVSGLAADGGNLVKQLRELGYEGLIIGGNGLNTTNVFPVCGAECDGVLIAQAYSPAFDNAVNKEFLEAYTAEQKKQPPQFSAQTFTAVQVFVEALSTLDKSKPIKDMDLKTLRTELNTAVLAGKYETPLGPIAFDPEGEIIQDKFYVAQIKMEADGKSGEFTFVR